MPKSVQGSDFSALPTRNYIKQSAQEMLGRAGYNVDQHVYPADLLDSESGNGHYIMFFINETIGGQFSSTNRIGTFNSTTAAHATGSYIATENNDLESRDRAGLKDAFESNDAPGVLDRLKRVKDAGISHTSLGNTTKRIQDAVVLYMPESLSTAYTLNWESDSQNPWMAAGLDILDDLLKGEIGKAALNTGSKIIEGLGRYTVRKSATLGLGYRVAINPNLLFLFRQPEPRKFSFAFKFIPRNLSEQQTAEEIIHLFKYHAHPSRPDNGPSGSAGLLWDYPDEFEIRFFSKSGENQWLSKIKPCALTNITVNYTGTGAGWAAHPEVTSGDYTGAPPVAINLELQFSELSILEKGDILAGY